MARDGHGTGKVIRNIPGIMPQKARKGLRCSAVSKEKYC